MKIKSSVTKAALNFLLVLISLTFTFGAIELFLRTGVLDGTENPRPVWIPQKFKLMDQRINARNSFFAARNPYGFTDSTRTLTRAPGIDLRLAILGDSFIWGLGIPFEDTWNHKLEARLTRTHKNVEVLSWGKSGYSTMMEYSFFQQYGRNYGVDVLLVGFACNDPETSVFTRTKKYVSWRRLYRLRRPLPNAFDFFMSYTNQFLYTRVLTGYGYFNWEESLYTRTNLEKYNFVLQSFKRLAAESRVRLIFVLTPNTNAPYYGDKLAKIAALLKADGIEYLNLYPMVAARFAGVNPRMLWANPANDHPGEALTDFYADAVYNYLEENKIIPVSK